MATVSVSNAASSVVATGGPRGAVVNIRNIGGGNIVYFDVVSTVTTANGWPIADTATDRIEIGKGQNLHAIAATGATNISVIVGYK